MGFERESGVVRRRSLGLFLVYFVYAFGALVPVVMALASKTAGAGPAAILLHAAGLVGLIWLWQKTWTFSRGRLSADERGIFLDGRCIAKREGLKHAYVVRSGERYYLRLARGTVLPPAELEVADDEEAREILRAIRFDPQSSVADYRFFEGPHKSEIRRLGLHGFGFAAGLAAAAMLVLTRAPSGVELFVRLPGLLVYASTTLGFLFVLQKREMKVSVGADGVRIRQLMKGTRFIPYRDLVDASISGKTVTLRLVDGSSVVFHHLAEGRSIFNLDREREGGALVERIREAQAAYRTAPVAVVDALDHGGRTASEWMQHARKLREDAAGYRVPVLPDEELWRIVEDVSATASARAGAALALRHGIDGTGRARLRLAAEACAEQRLRVALETATLEDDEALVLALEPLRA